MKEGMHKVQRRARVRRCNREPVWRRAVNGGIEVQCGGGVEVHRQWCLPSYLFELYMCIVHLALASCVIRTQFLFDALQFLYANQEAARSKCQLVRVLLGGRRKGRKGKKIRIRIIRRRRERVARLGTLLAA